MVRLLTFLMACILMLWCRFGASSNMEAPHIAYTKHFLQNYPRKLEKALGLMPVIEGNAALNALDPLVVVVVIALESSWMTRAYNPDKGEVGLMQVHGVCARGEDLSTPEGQIAAGARCLAMARDACDGSLRQMLTMYQSGSCKARTERTKTLINRRLRIIEKWGR